MKKTLLTTAAAFAMVAPTMTSFAAVTTETVTGVNTQSYNSELLINGTVQNADGQAPEGQISVTLPTSVSFVVDQDSNVIVADNMTITNNGQDEITVSVASFTDSNANGGITLVEASTLGSLDRSNVALTLTANGGTSIDLLSDGITETELVQIEAGKQTGLSLAGEAGKGAGDVDNTGASDTFTLVFKVAKN